MSNIEKKPDRSAVSLRYDNRVNKSPVVTAKGKGLIAEKIISLAKENNVPIIVFNMNEPGNLKKVVLGDEVGTLVEM